MLANPFDIPQDIKCREHVECDGNTLLLNTWAAIGLSQKPSPI